MWQSVRDLRPFRENPVCREFRDVVFEDVVFDNNSAMAPC